MITCCKNCKKRSVLCHSDCQEYIKQVKQFRREQKKKNNDMKNLMALESSSRRLSGLRG